MLVNDFILQPDKYLPPAYKISPFRTEDVARNRALPYSNEADDYFRGRFQGQHFVYCENGRQAIRLALQQLGLRHQDMVTILTTTGNRYISGCVTSQIEQFCQWSRTTEKNTKALFVNHEFGFPYEELHQLQSFGLPIIEDAAHSFASNNTKGNVSQIGDFTVYSFPKFFPIQAGGLLVFRDKYKIQEPVDPPLKQYIQKVVSHHLQHIDITSRKRRANHDYLTASFATLGFSSRFQVTHRSVPGVFMFKTDPSVDLDALKKHMWGNGVECSVFYGEQAFYIPVNDRLECFDLDYFFEAVKAFVNRANPSSNPSSPPPCIMSGGLNP